MNSSISNSNLKKPHLKKHITRLLLFLLLVFLFDRGLYYAIFTYENHFYPQNKFEESLSRFVRGKDYSTLIFGTSRSYEGILPAYLQIKLNQKMFKETFQGKGPKYNYYFYQVFKKYAGTPKVVIYGVDYFIYNIKSDAKWMSRFNNMKETPRFDFFSSPLLLLENKKRIDNFQNNILIRFQESQKEDKDDKDNKKDGESKKDDVLSELIDVQIYIGANTKEKKLITQEPAEHLYQSFPPFPGEEGDYFVKLLDELDRDHVTVILVELPDYIGTYKTNYQLKAFMYQLETFKQKYKNLFIYNYNLPEKFPLDNTVYFFDGGYGMTNSHLSREGSKVLNDLLARDLKKHYQ
ncbi:MAG: hypothetical protein ACM3SY_18745 [Candidatus Omnitrophota bacterium]